jgi:hypothetical protein
MTPRQKLTIIIEKLDQKEYANPTERLQLLKEGIQYAKDFLQESKYREVVRDMVEKELEINNVILDCKVSKG